TSIRSKLRHPAASLQERSHAKPPSQALCLRFGAPIRGVPRNMTSVWPAHRAGCARPGTRATWAHVRDRPRTIHEDFVGGCSELRSSRRVPPCPASERPMQRLGSTRLALLLLLAGCSHHTTTPAASDTITARGGMVATGDGASVAVPAGAVQQNTTITMGG